MNTSQNIKQETNIPTPQYPPIQPMTNLPQILQAPTKTSGNTHPIQIQPLPQIVVPPNSLPLPPNIPPLV